MELQQLLDSVAVAEHPSGQTSEKIRSIILEDPEYARGFFSSIVSRMMKILSPVVSKQDGRPFHLEAAIVGIEAKDPRLVLGLSFCPKRGDDEEALEALLAEEIVGVASMRGFKDLLRAVAINGSLRFSQKP